jgi:hypothetical protein
MIADIDGVTEQQIFQTARNLFTDGRIALTGLGPFSSRQTEELCAKFS